ncbi:unnamed protein product [Blepharisma stoltei]|uniref:Uncharacterized protein n=1 Tax=Blepharisma stoltei TaxID=1481888 RepID=A0AAU9IUC1_9CILI|nr:unnamed protein product [Blepharisma stoltei]
MASEEELTAIANGLAPFCCKDLHSGSCSIHVLKYFIKSMLIALKFYLPLNVVQLLLKHKSLRRNPQRTLYLAGKSMTRSSLMLSAMVAFSKLISCIFVRLYNRAHWTCVLWCGIATMPAALIETPDRICEMTLYILPRFFDALWKFLKRRQLVISLPFAHVLMFSLSLGAISWGGKTGNVKPMLKNALDKFFGIN